MFGFYLLVVSFCLVIFAQECEICVCVFLLHKRYLPINIPAQNVKAVLISTIYLNVKRKKNQQIKEIVRYISTINGTEKIILEFRGELHRRYEIKNQSIEFVCQEEEGMN